MKLRVLAVFLASLFPLALLSAPSQAADARSPWSLTVYSGVSNTNDLLEITRLRFGEFEPYWIVGAGLNRELLLRPGLFSLEWSQHLVKHLEKASLFELDQLIVFRWRWFPWNDFVPTTLGFGEGISLTTGFPSSETVSQNIRSLLLNYLLVDATFEWPGLPDWALNVRLHHRSGIYGVLFGIHGGSNYVCLGLTHKI